MQNSSYLLSRHKPTKPRKLGFFTMWELKWCGIKDCKSKIIRQGPDGQYSSPFLTQETNLCMATIRDEKEILIKILMSLDMEISAIDIYIEQTKEQIGRIQQTILPDIDGTNKPVIGNDEDHSEIIETYYEKEQKARVSAKVAQVNDLKCSIANNKARKEQKLKCKENEIEITKVRCYQLYELLKARLSVYWTGVLKADSSNSITSMPAILKVDDLMQEINKEFDSFEGRKHD